MQFSHAKIYQLKDEHCKKLLRSAPNLLQSSLPASSYFALAMDFFAALTQETENGCTKMTNGRSKVERLSQQSVDLDLH